MKKTWFLLIGVLAIGIIAFFISNKPVKVNVTDGGAPESVTAEALRERAEQIQHSNAPPGIAATQASNAPAQTPAPAASNPWNEIQTPEMTQSLVSFAEKLSPKMEEAEANLDKAREFFTELETCVSDSKTNTSPIQALCLSTAEELAEIHPEMMDRFRSLRSTAPGQVTQMLDAADAMDE